MRWTDLPAARPVQPLAAWRDALLARRPGARGTIEVLAQRAATGGERPLVLVEATAFDAALRHVRGSSLERGGLLVGIPVTASDAYAPVVLVHVTAAVDGHEEHATPLSLHLGTEVWSRASAQLGPDETVVGWFHSHPGIGAFFSETDRRTQAAFFGHAYSLGWVIDPVRGAHAWFCGAHALPIAASSVITNAT